jgi:hypothetical protein
LDKVKIPAGALLVVLATVCLSACSRDRTEVKLRTGFVVAPNSELVGAVFVGNEAWSAVLHIERDPVGVYDAYAAQARKLGVPLPGSGAHSISGPAGCQPKAPETQTAIAKKDRCYDLGPTCAVARGVFRCDVSADGGTDPRLFVNVSLAWGGETRHMLLAVSPASGEPVSPAPGIARRYVGRARYVGPLPESRERAQLARPGRPFGSENTSARSRYRRLTLESGSRVVADAPALDLAVLEITGDMQEVLSRYAEQLAAPGDNASQVTVESVPGGGTYLALTYSPEGGGGTTFVGDPSHRYVRVTWSSD